VVKPPEQDAANLLTRVYRVDPNVQLFHLDGVVVGRDASGGGFALEDLDLDGLRAVLGAIDGEKTVSEVAARLGREFDAGDVVALIAQLQGTVLEEVPRTKAIRGRADPLCIVGDGPMARRIADELAERGWSDIEALACPRFASCEAAEFRDGLSAVSVLGGRGGGLPPGAAPATTVEDLGSTFAKRALVVCALEDVHGQAILDVNAASLASGTPAIFVAAQGSRSVLGPTLVPWRSPCFACSHLATTLRDRYDGAGPDLLRFLPFGAHGAAPSWHVHRIACEVADEVARVLLGTPYPAHIGKLWVVDATGGATVERVKGVTTCPACHAYHRAERGDASSVTPSRPVVRVQADVKDRENGTRSTTTEDALRSAELTLDRIGVDVELVPLGASAPESFVAFACPYYSTRQTARFSPDLPIVWRSFVDPCLGKGVTDGQARCSALFEWIERNLSDWQGDHPLVRATYADVKDRAIDLPFLASGLLPNLQPVGTRPCTEAEEIDWVWAHCLRSQRPILLPAVCAFLTPTLFRGSDLALPISGSSGLSAGCTVADAVLQGLLEIVERDASATAMRNGLRLPEIDQETISDPAARDLLQRTGAAGYEAFILDMTADIGIPAIEVYLVREGEYTHYYGLGMGAHLDPDIALRRALTEAVQSLFYDVTQNAVDPLRSLGSRFDFFPYRQQSLVPRGGKRRMDEIPHLGDARAPTWKQVDRVVAKIASAVPESDICMVDLTPAVASGVHVVRTFASGTLYETQLIHFHIPERCRRVPLAEMFLGRYEG
jgi:thiazole/oxazole-forming peptide maturase SagD family component